MRGPRWCARLAAIAALTLAACGARVSVGFVDGPDANSGSPDGSSPPPPFAGDAARRDAGAPSPGCAGKLCGDLCTPCDDDAATCPPASLFHVCSSDDQCLPAQPGCVSIQELDGAPGPPSYVPCAGLACAAECTSCDPTAGDCPAPVRGKCHADGACGPLPADCR